MFVGRMSLFVCSCIMLFDEWPQRCSSQKICMHMQALTTCFFIAATLLAKLTADPLYEVAVDPLYEVAV